MTFGFEADPVRNRGRRTVYPNSVAAGGLAMVGAAGYRRRIGQKLRAAAGDLKQCRGESVEGGRWGDTVTGSDGGSGPHY